MAQAEWIIYDTHAEIRELTDAGMPERQAGAVVRGQVRIFERNLATKHDIEASRAATKGDIEASRAATKADIEVLRAETKADIATAKTGIILWIVGLVVGLDVMLGVAPEAVAWIADTLFKA